MITECQTRWIWIGLAGSGFLNTFLIMIVIIAGALRNKCFVTVSVRRRTVYNEDLCDGGEHHSERHGQLSQSL